jgi:hypothetical protein
MTTVRSSGIRLQIRLSSDQALRQAAASPQTLLGDSDALVNWAHRKRPHFAGPFVEAAEGIRTLDLLHGKQSVRRRFHANMPAYRRFLRTRSRRGLPGIHREITGVWVVNG